MQGVASTRWFDIDDETLPVVISNLPAGSYDVVVRDIFGCQSSVFSRTITQPTPITISNVSVVDINGCGGSGTGSITIAATGGTGTLNYYRNSVINTPATSGVFGSLNAGVYEIEIRDAIGCSQFTRATISAPWYPTAGNDVEVCNGSSVQLNGGIVGQAIGCIVSGSGTAMNACIGTSSFGCSDGDGINNFSTTNGITNITRNGTGCNGNANGYIDYADIVEVNAGNSFNFSLNVIQYIQGVRIWIDYNNNGAFEASESVWNSSNATTSFTGTITIPANQIAGIFRMRVRTAYDAIPTASAGACGSIQYSETEDYRVKVNGLGGCSPTYSWSPTTGLSNASIANPTISNATTNTSYTLTVNDGAGCVQTSIVNVKVSNLTATNSVTNVSCNGNNDGCITVNPTSGVGPYLLYGPSNTVQVANGRLREITINNANGSTLINHQVKLVIPHSSLMRSDFGDIRFFDASRNAVPYWVESFTLNGTAIVWVKVANLPAGNSKIYMVYGNSTLTSQNNGDAVFEFFDDFYSFNSSKWSSTGSYSMFNGRMNVTTGSVYSNNTVASQPGVMVEAKVNWANFITSYSGLCVANTQGTQGNNNGGSQIAYLMSDAGTPTNAIKAWGSNTAGSYNLTGGGVTQFSAATSTDYILGYDHSASGMNFYNNRNLTQAFTNGSWANPFYIYLGYFTGNAAGSIDVSDISVDWVLVRKKAPTEPTFTLGTVQTENKEFCGLSPNSYSIHVVDVASCSETENATVTQPTVLAISNSLTNSCVGNSNGSINLTLSGGNGNFAYNWSGPNGYSSLNNSIANLSTGVYNVVVADSRGCTQSASYTIATTQPNTNISVNGISISNGDYLWNGSSNAEWDVVANWYVFNGGNYTVANTLPATSINAYIVNSLIAGQCANNNVTIPANAPNQSVKDINISNGSQVVLAGVNNNFNVSGNWNNAGTFNATAGTIVFNGNINQTFSCSGGSALKDITLQNTALNGKLTMNCNLTINGNMQINQGELVVPATRIVRSNKVNMGSNGKLLLGGEMRVNE